MALKNKSKTQVSISGLSYDSLLADLYSAVKDSDVYKDSFTDFTSSEGSRLMAELYCYVAQQLATRIDTVGNELFVDTASMSGLSRLLKLVGYKLDFPSAAKCTVNVSTSSSNNETLSMSTGIDKGNLYSTLYPTESSFKAVSPSYNSNIKFEFIIYDSTTGKYDYTQSINYRTPTQNFIVCEGSTKYQLHTVNTLNKDIITLNSSPVEQGSVRIYRRNKVASIGSTYTVSELLEVDNFFSREAIQCTTGYYTVRNLGDGKCEIVLQAAETDMDNELIIMYRTTSGSLGNISKSAIDTTERRLLNNSTTNGIIRITNTTSGSGGVNEKTADEIRDTVSQEVRNSKIVIDENDYQYELAHLDSNIAFIRAFGEKNAKTDELAETYGYYANPLNVWLLILKYNRTFSDMYLSGEHPKLTEYINDICFEYLDINPRMNEIYQINTALINEKFTPEELNSDTVFDSVSNVYTLNLNENAYKALVNGNAKISVTDSPYIETKVAAKKGINQFNITNIQGDAITWNTLLAKTSVAVGTAFIVSDRDPNGEVYRRYRCKTAIGTNSCEADDHLKVADYSLTEDTTFSGLKKYFTVSGGVYTQATVTAGAAITADTYYERKYARGTCVITEDATFTSAKNYFIKNNDDSFSLANVTSNNPVTPANTYYEWESSDVTYYTRTSTTPFVYTQVTTPTETDVGFYYIINTRYWENFWEVVDYEYMYDNLVNESNQDVLYVLQGDSDHKTTFTPVFSKKGNAFSTSNANWNQVSNNTGGGTDAQGNVQIKLGVGTTLDINGTRLELCPTSVGTFTKQSLVNAINTLIASTTQMVVLKDDIIADSRSDALAMTFNTLGITTSISFVLQKTAAGSTPSTITISSPASNDTYQNVVNKVTAALNIAGLGNTYKIDVAPKGGTSGCYQLVIICADAFIFTENSANWSASKGFYTHYLNNVAKRTNDPTDGNTAAYTTGSFQQSIPSGFSTSWSNYDSTPSNGIAYIDENGNVALNFFSGNDSLQISSSNLSLTWLFGFNDQSPNTVHTTLSYRRISCTYTPAADGTGAAVVKILISNPKDLITKTIYINIFGGSANTFTLGSYYTNLSLYNPDLVEADQGLAELLARPAIKRLYSTRYITNDAGADIVDKYGSNYQVKFSAKKTTKQTFEQTSAGLYPASVMAVQYSASSLKQYPATSYLYIKVDTKDFEGAVITVDGVTKTISATLDGFAKFPLSIFSDCSVGELISAIVDAFTKENMTGTNRETLLTRITNDSYSGFRTVSSDFASSIDFGITNQNELSYLFGINEKTIVSEEGQINAGHIKYKLYSLTNDFCSNKSVVFNITGVVPVVNETINTGASLNDFVNNINNSTYVKNYVIFDNSRIVFNKLDNRTAIQLSVDYTSQPDRSSIESMFIDEFDNTPSTGTYNTLVGFQNSAELNLIKNVINEARVRDNSGVATISFPWANNTEKNFIFNSILTNYWTRTGDTLTMTIPYNGTVESGVIDTVFVSSTIGRANNVATITKALSGTTEEKNRQEEIIKSILLDPEEVDITGTLSLKKENSGDYYITEVTTGGNTVYTLKVENPEVFPYGDVYFHMFEDYTNDHVVSTTATGNVYTDEYVWNSLLKDKKVVMTEHIYKQPSYIPFDLKVTCYIDNTVGLDKAKEFKTKVENVLRNEYGVFSSYLGDLITNSDISLKIVGSIPEIRNVTVNYLGFNMSDSDSSSVSIDSEFNQKLILAANQQGQVLVQDATTGVLTSTLTYVHGLDVTVLYR